MLAALPLGLAIGLSLGLVGGGGAVLATPVLVYLLGEDIHAATTTSLVVVTAAAIAGALRMRADGQACVRPGLAFALPAAAAAVAGTVANRSVDGDLLIALFAPVLVAAGVLTWRRGATEGGGDAACPPATPSRMVPAGIFVGLLTGFFGVGGGFLVVPALVISLHVAMRRAVATSMVVVAIVSAVALGAHLAAGGGVDWDVAGPFAAGAVAGALAGTSVSARIPQLALARGFAFLVAGVGVYLLAASAFMGGPPTG